MNVCVLIYVNEPDALLLVEMLAGLEEEGVPARVVNYGGDALSLAEQAVARSALGVGVGFNGAMAVVAMKPRCTVLFEGRLTAETARAAGAAAARAVKKRRLGLVEQGGPGCSPMQPR